MRGPRGDELHTRTIEHGGEPGRMHVTGMACSCGWHGDGPAWVDFDKHLRALGICAECRNTGVIKVENGNARYTKVCRRRLPKVTA